MIFPAVIENLSRLARHPAMDDALALRQKLLKSKTV